MNKKGLLLVLSTAIISGFSVFINKYAVGLSNPNVFAFLKNSAVALLITALIFALKDQKIFRSLKIKQWSQLILIGLIGGSVPFLLFFKGLALTSAAQGSFIQKTMFIYVAIIASIFLKEKISKNFLIGALLLLLGNIIALKSLKFTFGYGDLLILTATLFWAVENVISKYVLRDLPPNVAAWGRMFFGSLLIFAYLGLTGQTGYIVSLNAAQIAWTTLTALLLFGYVMTWYGGLKLVSVSKATSVLLLGSPITTALTLISNGRIDAKEIISALLIAAGLVTIIFAQKIGFFSKMLTTNH